MVIAREAVYANSGGRSAACRRRPVRFVPHSPGPADFRIVERGKAADIYVDEKDWECNRKGAEDLAKDIFLVTGTRPRIRHSIDGLSTHVILIGTLGRSLVIDRLASENRIAAGRIRGKWEGSLVQVVERPLPAVERALVLAGSDRRDTSRAAAPPESYYRLPGTATSPAAQSPGRRPRATAQ